MKTQNTKKSFCCAENSHVLKRLSKWYVAGCIILTNTLILLMFTECSSFLILHFKYAPPKKRPSPLLEFEYAPYRMMKTKVAGWPINKDGFRAKPLEYYHQKSQQTFRIVFLGGSVAIGYGKNNGDPLSDLLQKRLLELGLSQVEVINLGQGGAVSAQELAILLQYGLPLRPQIVVSFNGVNDFMFPYPIGSHESPNLPYQNKRFQALWADDIDSKSMREILFRKTSTGRLLQIIKQKFQPQPSSTYSIKKEVPIGEVVNSYIDTMDIINHLTKPHGITHMVMLQPTSLVNKPLSSAEREFLEQEYTLKQRQRTQILFQKSAALLKEQALHGGSRFYDLTDAFSNEPQTIYMDSCHFSNIKGYPRLLEVLEQKGFIAEIRDAYNAWVYKSR
jgi:hypothetical protein